MDTALYVFVLKKKRYVAFINCLACRFSAAGEQLESVKYVACNIVHFFLNRCFLKPFNSSHVIDDARKLLNFLHQFEERKSIISGNG